MKDGVLERVIAIVKENSKSENEFAKAIGMNQKTLNQQLKGDRSLSLDTILKIISSFDHINVDWLMTGKGDMLKDTNTDIENLKEELAMLKGENRVLREQIGLGEKKESKHRSA
ncbi:MAG: helix-turn-helix domain-containing protein [Bacteroides xylanisolvens]